MRKVTKYFQDDKTKMFSFFLAALTCEASFSEFILGEWYVERIADNGTRTKDLENQIYSIEFHKLNDSDKIVGTLFKNNLRTDFDVSSETGFVDTFEVEITDVKFIMASQKNYIGQKLELEYTDNEGKWALTGKILDEEITITFKDQKTADVLYNGTQYIFERESWPEAAPLSDIFKKTQTTEQKKAPRQLSFYETFMIALAPYKKYKYLLYTAALIFIAETIILTCGFPCFGRSEKKHKAPVKNADDPKKGEEEEEKAEKANEKEESKEKEAAKEEEESKE